ncbi:transposase [candidate division KSB1 bacterium]|nr:transposase [candidate division KSB1 bacterium]
MANTLKMEKQILIKQLLKLGWSYRRIEKETGIRRETISKYDPNHPRYCEKSKAAKVPIDPEAANAENRPKCPPTESAGNDSNKISDVQQKSLKPTRTSNASKFDSIIQEKLLLGLSAQRIYQDLVCEYEFDHSYDCIKRYVRRLLKKTPKVFARIHTKPGEEAQVDFGKGAPTLKNGRYVRPWFFKMVLSYSRHSYEECVWKQDVETFIECHEHAFEAFGGVPSIISIDYVPRNIIRHQNVRTAFKKFKRFDTGSDECRLCLIHSCLCVGIATCCQSCNKYLYINQFTGVFVYVVPG